MRDKMKFIPYSNGFYKIKHKKIMKPGSIFKKIILTIIFILLAGAVYQYTVDKVEIKSLTSKDKYVRIDGKKYFFNSVGNKKPTIILDSNLGLGLNQWTGLQSVIADTYDLRTFAYDRAGYGFSEYGKDRNLEEQARLLRMILKKLSLNGPYILLGEGYGSLVMSNFAKLYPELVQGVILVNPINEESLKNDDYIKQFKSKSLSSTIEKVGSYIGLNELMFKMGIIKSYDGLSQYISPEEIKMYNVFRTKKNFASAYSSEIENIVSMQSNSQIKGMFNNVPLAIVVDNNNFKNEQEFLSQLGNEQLTKIINVDKNTTGLLSIENNDSILEAIKFVLDNSENNEQER